jgi:trehalose-phosphatase
MYFFDCLPEIDEKLRKAQKFILMFDFDGTLSQIAKTPKKAYLKESTKSLLKKLGEHFYVAVISGRALFDIKSKVGISNLIYAGNHGLQWQIGEKIKTIKFDAKIRKRLLLIKKTFKKLLSSYPGAFVEDKYFTLSVHYRLLDKKICSRFIKDAAKIISPIKKNNTFLVVRAKKTIEIRPKINWDKGSFAGFLVKQLEKKNNCSFLPIYVGDDVTDEDAFTALKKNGITVRVGKRAKSSAQYYIKSQKQVDKFFAWLLDNCRS